MRPISLERVVASENSGTLAVMAAPLIGLVALDLLMLLVGLGRPIPWLSGKLIMYGHLLFAPLTFWVTTLAMRLGNRGPIICLAALSLSFIVMTRFRGPWVWQGTLDWWKDSEGPWLWPSLAGLVAGFLCFKIPGVRNRMASNAPSDLNYILALAMASVAAFAGATARPLDSIFAPTLHLALGGCALVLGAVWAIVVRPEIAT